MDSAVQENNDYIIMLSCLDEQVSVTLVDIMLGEKGVTGAARKSFKKSMIKGEFTEKDKSLLDRLIFDNHSSPLEFFEMVFDVKGLPIQAFNQLERHRFFKSLPKNVLSFRYQGSKIKIYEPVEIKKQHDSNKQCSGDDLSEDEKRFSLSCIKESYEKSVNCYNDLVGMGVSREIARGVLPMNLCTDFYLKLDANNFLKFCKLRYFDHGAQKEIMELAKTMFECVRYVAPNLCDSYERARKIEMLKTQALVEVAKIDDSVRRLLDKFFIGGFEKYIKKAENDLEYWQEQELIDWDVFNYE